MKRIEAYAAKVNTDTVEGRGPDRIVAYFTHETTALAAVKGLDTMGTDGRAEFVSFTIYDTLAEYKNDKKASVREQALSKLTREEREALGIDED